MIKRIFKTIFILTLCLGITLPANAGSVQVSDGSAFITKSELSYQLNNLSNRMTQLENSLDSKIDTLVSSYLTRNGIWNGTRQNITNNTCYAYSSFTQSAGYLRSWVVNNDIIRGQTDYVNSAQYKKPSGISKTNRTTFTGSLTKSGLLYCRFDVLAWSSAWIRIIPHSTTNGSQLVQGFSGYYRDWMQITIQDNTLKFRDSTSVSLMIGGGYSLPTYHDRVIFFFVQKNDVLYFETGAECSFSNIVTDDGTSQYGRKWVMKEISIY